MRTPKGASRAAYGNRPCGAGGALGALRLRPLSASIVESRQQRPAALPANTRYCGK